MFRVSFGVVGSKRQTHKTESWILHFGCRVIRVRGFWLQAFSVQGLGWGSRAKTPKPHDFVVKPLQVDI